MAKQLNVNLGFTADTSQAKAKIQELQNSLTVLTNTPTGNFGNKMTKDIQQGIKAAAELKTHLKNATNVETGSLDFSKLNQSIKQSGSSLDAYGQKLQALGADGQKAFMQFAQAVATSEIPIRRSNALLTEMWTTLKNTARWQISSSILHGFMGALQSAYGYAQDLNESLNNIRIVTGKNIDEMATFSVQANKAAKALSATTTEYTDASLIYYQQGLDGAAVEERAAVTLKMANVSRQSAEVVSDQMTAVWNNFYDGSKSLEYYADVMTALGAATASSTDEISQGLEKFAAVADTVGLSYEYATAALATVTAETRQSADVVGTAFKTLFARIEGLSLGETLDDGTNLNKYSEALLKVGINVKDQNGQLKDMDSILNEMGSKWSTLAKDQQVALAQTVGGVRQYNQLISLMDNWDKFQQNLGTAQGSTGALQEQADIYAESWEAAQDRVRAAAEAIYSDLLNDEAFIDILNIVEDFLTLIDNIIDSVGGLQGVLTNVGAILLKVFSSQMSQGITNMAYSFQMMTKAGRQKVQNEKTQFIDNAVNSIQVDNTATPNANTRRQEMLKAELEVQKEMIEASGRMSELEQQTNQILLDRQRVLSENAIKTAETEDAAKERVSNAHMAGRIELAENQLTGGRYVNPDFVREDNAQYTQLTNTLSKTIALDIDLTELLQLREQAGLTEQDFSELATKISKLENVQLDGIIADIKSVGVESEHGKEYVDQLLATIRMVINNTQSELDSQLGISPEAIEELSAAYREETRAVKESEKANKEAKKAREASSKSIKAAKGAQKQWSDTLVQSAESALSLVSALQSFINLGNIWTDDNLTGGEKLLQTFMALGTAIPMLINGISGIKAVFPSIVTGFNSLKSAISSFNLVETARTSIMQFSTTVANQQAMAELKRTASLWKSMTISRQSTVEERNAIAIKGMRLAAEKLGIKTTEEMTGVQLKKLLVEKLGLSSSTKTTVQEVLEAAARKINTSATIAETGAKSSSTLATIAATAANWGFMASISPILAIVLLLVATIGSLVAIVWIAVKAFQAWKANSPEGKLAAAEEQAQKFGDALNRVTEAVNASNEALEKLESQYETLKTLTRGTEEWKKAIQDINAEVLHLLETYPELSKYVYQTEDGAYNISQEGKDYIEAKNRQRLAVATNLKLGADKTVNWVKYDNLNNELWSAMGTQNSGDYLRKMYDSYGEQLFTREGAKAAFETINPGSYYSEDFIDKYYEALVANKDKIIEMDNLSDTISMTGNVQMSNFLTSFNSKRSVEQGEQLIGGSYNEIIKQQRDAIEIGDSETAFDDDWNDRANYNSASEQWDDIQNFMSTLGDDVKYVAQRKGKMVVEIDGEEKEFTQDEFLNGLAEYYGSEEVENKFREGLESSLTRGLSNVDVSNLSDEQLVNLDNFKLGLEESFTNIFPDATAAELQNKVDTTFGSLVDIYGTSEQALASFAEDTQYIDITGRDFQAQVELLNEGAISADQFAESIRKLNAQGEILSMDEWFKTQADSLGLKEEDAGKMQEYAKNLMELSEESGELSDSLASDAQSAADLAVEITRMNKGIDSLADGFEDWSDVIKKSSKASAEYSDAMFEMKSALADVLDVESDLISSDFVEDHLDDIEKAATGDADAIDKLRASMDEEMILNITKGQTDAFVAEVEALDEKLQSVANDLPDIEVGAILDDSAFLEAANNLVEQSGMTADEANAYFAGIGYEPVYNQEEINDATSMSSPNATTEMKVTSIGFSEEGISIGGEEIGFLKMPTMTVETASVPKEPEEQDLPMRLTSFSGGTTPPKIRGMRKKATGSQNNYSSANKGGKGPGSSSKSSGSGSKNNKKTKKSDVVERYKEITDQLDDVTRATDKASKAADRLYGPARLKAMKDVSKSLKEELNLLEKKSKEVAQNYADDQFHLNSVSKSAGLNFEYDESGNIINYTSEMNKLYNQVAAAEASGDEDAIELAQLKVDTITDAIDQYDETRELWEDVADEMDEKFYEWQDNNAAIFEYELEIKIDATEFENKFLDFEKDWFADDAYSFAESVAATGQLLQNSEQNLQSYSQSFNELQQLFAEGKISQAAFMEQIQNLSDGTLEEFGNIIEYDKEMMEAYGTQLELNSEELAKYTDRLDHLNSVLEHYNNLLDLTGQSQNYDANGKVLAIQEKNAANIYEVNKAYFDDKQAEADALKAQLDAALVSGNEEAAELYQKQWEDADAAAREAQENMLSSAESWAEAIKATLENKLAGLADTLADALTGGKGFDQLNTELERLEATQEEFLTTTNKIYETNKLINTAQKEIDKTNNTVAKQKLKAFQQETSQLQNQGQLSQFELDIQQKKYDLLLAEIALEEAQNAKSVVRLQKDSEGNFGYVYTADEQKIADAEQNVADAENALYNTQLEGANKYVTQRQELIQAMYDEMTVLTEAYHNGEIQSEAEYEALMQETQAYYYDRLANNSRLYKVATSEDSRIVQEAWSSNLSIMSIDGQEFEKAVNQYMINTKEYLQEFENKMDDLAEQVGIDADSLDDSLGEVEQASEDLTNEVVNKLLPAQQQNLDKIKLLTDAYAINRTNTDLLKTAYGQLATAMETAYTNAANLETQLRNTNQAAQLIGGTGWVQWDYFTGNDNGSDGGPGGGEEKDQKSVTITLYKADTLGGSKADTVTIDSPSDISVGKNLTSRGASYAVSYNGNTFYISTSDKLKLHEAWPSSFDTGGYTGEWGSSEGKLAMLHEKEIILNKEDTTNFLASLELLHNIIKMIDINTSNSLISKLDSADLKTNKSNDVLEQHVTIEAVFPNVEDRYEIEEAFMNLTNEASQYINRKNN